jgi:predicted enzyme related to lactoylglutathione lyase
MADTNNQPGWVDLSSDDAAAAREFYGGLFGWDIEVNPDPQYGGYALARINGNDVAGIGPKQDPNAPSVWSVYIDTDDIDALAGKVSGAGGTVVMAPFDVGDQGRMAVFQDPTGAYISGWQAARMRSFEMGKANELGWVELNANGVAGARCSSGCPQLEAQPWRPKTAPCGSLRMANRPSGKGVAGRTTRAPSAVALAMVASMSAVRK